MATTKIWPVRDSLRRVVEYVENPAKTMPEQKGVEETSSLENLVAYATQEEKTALAYYVTGLHCLPDSAIADMNRVKRQYGKEGGIVAIHGYQSFAPGEIDADTAHEIGIKLAQELWGDRFQIVVATHLDKENHLHTHFVVNSVSYLDGLRFRCNKTTYYQMRKASDHLCHEYGLSVIVKPQQGKRVYHGEWQANQEGRPTWRTILKDDVDRAIAESRNEYELIDKLHHQGYEVKIGVHFAVRPPGKERFSRLDTKFGADYEAEAIRKRLLIKEALIKPLPEPIVIRLTYRYHGNIHQPPRKLKGLRALYFHYLYKLGILPKPRPDKCRMHFLLKEDLLKLDTITQEARLLSKNHIDTTTELNDYKTGIESQIAAMTKERARLQAQLRSSREPEAVDTAKTKITAINQELKQHRKEVKLCDNIASRSVTLPHKIHQVNRDEKPYRKELKAHEYERSCGSGRPHDPERR